MFKWLFKIRKLRALQKIHDRHLPERDAWIKTYNSDMPTEGMEYCYEMAEFHRQQARKIESQIKLLT